MRKHVFVARPANVSPRWLEAFPDAGHRRHVRPGADGAFVGLSAELPDWRTRLSALAATPGCDVVLLSLQPDDGEALAAFELGARGYAHALATAEMLREADAVIAHGGLWVGPALMARLLRALGTRPTHAAPRVDVLEGLSAREREVAEAVAEGLSNKGRSRCASTHRAHGQGAPRRGVRQARCARPPATRCEDRRRPARHRRARCHGRGVICFTA